MSLLPCIACGILGWGMVRLVTPWLLKHCNWLHRRRRADLHHSGGVWVPRLGGLSLAIAYTSIACFVELFCPEEGEWEVNRGVMIISPLAIFTVGFWDDLKGLEAKKKLLGQTLIALAVATLGIRIACPAILAVEGPLSPEAWETIVTVAWLVTCTNVTNLVDGVDGLAGSIGLVLMTLMICLSQGALVWVTAGMTGALLAFLWFNLSPARVYLGDGGAYFVGFQVGLLSILASKANSQMSLVILPLFGMALPMLDTALAVTRRGLKGLPVFRPDRNHLHHHLLQAGVSPRRLVLWYGVFTIMFVAVGCIAVFWPGDRLAAASFLVMLLLILELRRLKLKFSGWGDLWRSFSGSWAMRREIAYALCLRKWLKHEADRCSSVEELYADLRMAARRLGFTSVRLALADGSRTWKQSSVCGPMISARHSLQGGRLGVLELEAPQCRLTSSRASSRFALGASCGPSCQPVLNDLSLIRILSELLAESWVEATRYWDTDKIDLRFDHQLPQNSGIARRGTGYIHSGREGHRGPTAKRRGLLASAGAGCLKRTWGMAIWATLLATDTGIGNEWTNHRIPRLELPARAADLVKKAEPSERGAVTLHLIKTAGRVSPAVGVATVGAIAKAAPETAALAAGAAAQENPKQATAIAKAAAAGAPSQRTTIVLAVGQAAPSEYINIVSGVERVVPGESGEILEALASLFSERQDGSADASRSAVLDRGAGQLNPKPLIVRNGPSTSGGSPLLRPPRIAPPFVPFSGTLTNVASSSSTTVPRGGRNYAKP